jgi:carbon monoxide dehydrogenase subunit G
MLQDPEVLAKAMPGCDQLNRIGPDEYEMKMKMVISSIQGLFAGKVRIEDQNPPHSFKLVVEGNGKVGFMKGSGVLQLTPHEAHTEVAYHGDVQVGGMIASVGQRLMETTAKFVIRKFFDKLQEQMSEGASTGSAPA